MTTSTREWRPVVGWGHWYEVSRCGRVRTVPRMVPAIAPNGARVWRMLPSRLLRQSINRRGHRRVMLHAPARRTHAYVHTLVAAAFIGPRPVGLLVCHRDDIKKHNHADNLYYGDRIENAQDAKRNGSFGRRKRARGKRQVAA